MSILKPTTALGIYTLITLKNVTDILVKPPERLSLGGDPLLILVLKF